MSYRPVYLLKYQSSGRGRKHVAIFIPNSSDADKNPMDRNEGCEGTIIHVVGAPMSGYSHQFKRNYNSSDPTLESATQFGSIDARYIPDPPNTEFSSDQQSSGANTLDDLALRLQTPPISHDWMNPANAANIRDCQDWAQDYVARLVSAGIISQAAVQIMNDFIDPPVAIQLRATGSNVPAPVLFNSQVSTGPSTVAQAPAIPQQQRQQRQQQQPAAVAGAESPWVWDSSYNQYKRWDATSQIWVFAKSAPIQVQLANVQPQAQAQAPGGWEHDPTARRWRRWDAASGRWIYG